LPLDFVGGERFDEKMPVVNLPPNLGNIILQESYVLDISRNAKDVSFAMEFLLENGQTPVGRLVFPDVEAEEWLNTKGELASLNQLIAIAHRYYGAPDEQPDLGTINSILYDGGHWVYQVTGEVAGCGHILLSKS
jgi:hypothetical protein